MESSCLDLALLQPNCPRRRACDMPLHDTQPGALASLLAAQHKARVLQHTTHICPTPLRCFRLTNTCRRHKDCSFPAGTQRSPLASLLHGWHSITPEDAQVPAADHFMHPHFEGQGSPTLIAAVKHAAIAGQAPGVVAPACESSCTAHVAHLLLSVDWAGQGGWQAPPHTCQLLLLCNPDTCVNTSAPPDQCPLDRLCTRALREVTELQPTG
jgi:hypothetical protein